MIHWGANRTAEIGRPIGSDGGGQVQPEELGGEEDSPGGEGDAIEPLRRFHELASRGLVSQIPNPNYLFDFAFSLAVGLVLSFLLLGFDSVYEIWDLCVEMFLFLG